MIAGLAGIVWMLWNDSTRRVAVSWIAFALLLLLALVSSRFQPFRNLLSLVPPLCIAAALLCDLVRRISRPPGSARSALSPWLAPGIGSVCRAFAGLVQRSSSPTRERRTSTRAFGRSIGSSSTPRKNRRFSASGSLQFCQRNGNGSRPGPRSFPGSKLLDLLQRQRFDYIVTGEFDLRYATDPDGLVRLSRSLEGESLDRCRSRPISDRS